MDNPYGLPDDVFAGLIEPDASAPQQPTHTCPAECCNRPDPYWTSMARYEDDRAEAWARSDHPDAVRQRALREVQRGFSAAWNAAPVWNDKQGQRRDWDIEAYLLARTTYFAEHWRD